MSDFVQPLGDCVRQARIRKELTQAQVADKINADTRTILNIENYNGNPKMQILYPLVRTLNIDANEIFYPERQRENSDMKYINLLLGTCNEQELAALRSIMEMVLSVLRSNNSFVKE